MDDNSESKETHAAEPTQDGLSLSVATTPTASPRRLSEVDRRVDALTESLKIAKFDPTNSKQGGI